MSGQDDSNKCSVCYARGTAYGIPIERDYMVNLLRIYGMLG